MLCTQGLNNKICSLHERALRKYGDNNPSFQSLLEKDSFVSIYQRNLQLLTTKIFKVHKNMISVIIYHFLQTHNYDLPTVES